MITGSDFNKIFENKVDKAYSVFLDSTETNLLFRESLYLAIENKYRQVGQQRDYDALLSNLTTNKVFKVSNNVIYVKPIPLSGLTNVLTLFTATTFIPHNLNTGDTVKFADIQGSPAFNTTPNLNGNFFTVTVLTSTTFTFSVSAFVAGTYVANSGKITEAKESSVAKMIPDYIHLLALKTKIVKPVVSADEQLTIKKATNAQPIVLTVSSKTNNLRTYELVTTSGIVGNPNANGTYFIRKINSTQFALYYDKALLLPVSGNGDYTGNGIISRSQYNYAQVLFPSEKAGKYAEPTIREPKVERGENLLKLLPEASEITIDYVNVPLKEIISTDTAIDLEIYYPSEFLYFVADVASNLFAQRYRDMDLYNTSARAEQQNQ